MSAYRALRLYRGAASELLLAGWRGPAEASAVLGCSREELARRAGRGEIRRRSIAPGIHVYEVFR